MNVLAYIFQLKDISCRCTIYLYQFTLQTSNRRQNNKPQQHKPL